MRVSIVLTAVCLLAVVSATLPADTFTYQNRDGTEHVVDAALIGEREGMLVLGMPDGQYRLVEQAAIKDRKPGEDPAPWSHDEVAKSLEAQFGAEAFRSHIQQPYVMGLVLTAPLPKNMETRAKNFLRRAATFMKNVDSAFGAFAKEARLEVRNPVFPLVVLIFETDADFETYTNHVTGGRGLSAGNISGFYSGLTNALAIRLSECTTFDVPLHEAIHQQVYNRNVFRRLSPVPHWFDEGIATGFESSEGKISIGPTKISPRYARLALSARELSWSAVMEDDRAFAGDVLAGEAYGHAWSLHWLLVSKYRSEYAKYVRLLAAKLPLQKDTPEQRQSDFRECFGKSVTEMQAEFGTVLEAGLKRQKVDLSPQKPPGYVLTQQNAGEAQVAAVTSLTSGSVEVRGTLKNISPLRPMAYHVTVETDAGTYAEWFVPNLDVAKTANLTATNASKRMVNGRGGFARTFRVRVNSVPSNSATAQAWSAGNLPVPVFGN